MSPVSVMRFFKHDFKTEKRMEWKDLSCRDIVSTKGTHAVSDKPFSQHSKENWIISPLTVASRYSKNVLHS